MAVLGRPYGANASLNLRIDAVETGSLPLSKANTLLRSSSGSPSFGRPRNAACSKAKFGAAEKVGPASSGWTASSRIHRLGRRTKAVGLMIVMQCPTTDGTMAVTRPMSWNSGSHMTPRWPSSTCSAVMSCARLVPTAR
jgi:hypothetical protein